MRVLMCQAPCVPVMLCDLGGGTCPLWALDGLSIKQVQTQLALGRGHLLNYPHRLGSGLGQLKTLWAGETVVTSDHGPWQPPSSLEATLTRHRSMHRAEPIPAPPRPSSKEALHVCPPLLCRAHPEAHLVPPCPSCYPR